LRRWYLVASIVVAASALPVHATQPLPEPVARVATALRVPHASISAWVQDVTQPTPLLDVNGTTPRSPASTMKLVTTFAALEALGPAYTWKTDVVAGAPPRDGRVEGDLWIRGRGDPYLVVEEVWKMVGELRRRGAGTVGGDVVFDDSYFDVPAADRGAFDGQPDRVYNAVPHPFLVNFNAIRFMVRPRGQGLLDVVADPSLPNLRVTNRLTSREGACGGFQRGVALTVRDANARDEAVLEGRYPSGCADFELTRTVLQPDSYAFGLLQYLFRLYGGDIAGGWRTGRVPDGLKPVYVHASRPLGDLVKLVNKFSNNVMTLHVALTLGAERLGEPGTLEKGERAIVGVLTEHGIPVDDIVVDNPAGLSRDSRISAGQLAAVLQSAWRSPYMAEFVSSLALTGLDGTMRQRAVRGVPPGRMHMKTGTLDDVSSIAGFVTAASGRRFIVVVLVNAPGVHRGPGEEVQDALLAWAYRL
jgi:D-alanyl-D-alanine carboxypeptidase/D-alanyl-D-alanine-endopeptidase (penicillin-binding protein 4)